MRHHPYFDLWLHDDRELVLLVGSEIAERVTLHEWPLSCVQRLTLGDGRRLIYKTQYGPTVEPEVYAQVRSSLLPWAETIYRADGHACMLIEYIDAPMFEDLEPSEEDVMRVGREVQARIAEIDGERPCYIDVGDEAQWAAYVETMLAELSGLVERGALTIVTPAMVRDLARRAQSAAVLDAIRARPGYVHRDMSADNILVLPEDSYRVIDWQRPLLGPVDLDLVDLLNSLGYDPLPHVDAGVVQVWILLSIGWLTEAKARWFPEGQSYDRQIADLAIRLKQ
jgi:Ser/Thr protein kinase RdoA (MazF antagonist)